MNNYLPMPVFASRYLESSFKSRCLEQTAQQAPWDSNFSLTNGFIRQEYSKLFLLSILRLRPHFIIIVLIQSIEILHNQSA